MLHSINRDGYITEVSELWLAKLGYTLDEVLGRRSVEFLTEDSARYAREVVLPTFFQEGNCEVEYEMRRKDGTILPVRLQGVAVYNERGEFVRSIAVIEDLTERRTLERKMLEVQTLDSLGLMAGNIAHDFSNLLASIIGSTQTAAHHAGRVPAAASALDNVLLAASRAVDLCAQLLAYSGRGRFELHRVELDRLIAEMVPVLKVPVGPRARIVLELAGDGTYVDVDATQIRQVLMNLVINAADAVGEMKGTITIRTARAVLGHQEIAASARPEAPPGAYTSFSVSDDGCGMSPGVRARVFEPFFTTKATGRGLGLAATLGIVRGHRGTLTIGSEPGHGTRFTVFLPVAEGPPSSARASTASGASRPCGKVLIVDDDDLVRATIRRQLDEAGIDTLVARSGDEALALIASEPIATCLIDVSMPGMSGPALAARLADAAPGAGIILMSGFDRIDVPTAIGTRFLRKPFTEQELLAAITPRS